MKQILNKKTLYYGNLLLEPISFSLDKGWIHFYKIKKNDQLMAWLTAILTLHMFVYYIHTYHACVLCIYI